MQGTQADVVTEPPVEKHREEIVLRVQYDRYDDEPALVDPIEWAFRFKFAGLAVRKVEILTEQRQLSLFGGRL